MVVFLGHLQVQHMGLGRGRNKGCEDTLFVGGSQIRVSGKIFLTPRPFNSQQSPAGGRGCCLSWEGGTLPTLLFSLLLE